MAVEIYDMTFGGINASTYDVFTLSGEKSYDMPTRQVELVEIPGRNGSLPIDKGSYDNITVEYDCFCYGKDQADFRRKISAFTNAITSKIGYQRLSDTYHPDTYRMAMFIEGLEVTKVTGNENMGRFTLKFNCKPQRYLASGEAEIEVSNGDVVNNPTLFDASPLLMIDGYGTVSFNSYDIEITQETIDVPDVLWEAETKNYKNNMGSSLPTSITITKTFDKSYFLSGDEVTFNARWVYGLTRNSGNPPDPTITNSDTDITSALAVPSSDSRSMSVTTEFENITVNVGTSSEYTNTTTIVDSSYNVTYTVTFKATYDGNSTVTIKLTRTTTNNSFNGSGIIFSIDNGTGQSTYVPSSDTMYLDCELGEAYSRNGGEIASLNGFVDLGSDLPKLASGNNTFALDNTITSLVLIPRWWKL